MNKTLAFIVLLIILTSCSSTKNATQTAENFRREYSGNIVMKATISPQFPDFEQSFSADIRLAGYDSVSLNAIGPFGIALGKLYANNDNFVFYNVFENTVYTGRPSSENLYKAARINLSFQDLIAFLRCELPGNMADYKIYEENDKQIVYVNKIASQGAEFLAFSKEYKAITQYQRKDANNLMELNVSLSEFAQFDKTYFAKKITFDFPKIDGKLSVNIENIELNKQFGNDFRFSTPKSAKVKQFDK